MDSSSSNDCRENLRRRAFSRLAQMARFRRSALVFGLAAAAALALPACGGEDAKLLPGQTAREITANLDTVQQLSDEGDCAGAESAVQQVGEQIEAIEGVDRTLKQALEDGAARLEEVIVECEEESAETTSPTLVPSEEDEDLAGDEAKERKEEEKEREAEEKERERAEKEAEREEGDGDGDSEPPPQGKGEGNGKGPAPPAPEEAPEEGSSGGVAPSAPVDEGNG